MKKVGGSQQKHLSNYPQCMVYFSNGDNLEMYLQNILLPMLPVHLCRLLSVIVDLCRKGAIMLHELLSTQKLNHFHNMPVTCPVRLLFVLMLYVPVKKLSVVSGLNLSF